MVVTVLPCTSGPRTRHEFTSRPSRITLHAPQLPLLQPSLLPVSLSSSRSTSKRLCRGSQRKSAGFPLMVAWTWSFFDIVNFPLRDRWRYATHAGSTRPPDDGDSRRRHAY